MPNDVTILTLGDRSEWERLEANDAAPSQCWRFASALTLSGLAPRLAVIDAEGSRLLLPFVERKWHDVVDIATLPGLSGASITPPSAAPLERWKTFASAAGWVTGYIQLSAETFPNVPADAQPVHQTHMFLLRPPDWRLEHSTSVIIRRKVAASLHSGAELCDDRATLSASLGRLYPETLARFGTVPDLSTDTVDEWARDSQTVLLGVTVGGVVELAHLIHVQGCYAELHIVAATVRGRPFSAFLYAAAIDRLRVLGVTRFNLGGGGNPGDGLYIFKSWLGATPVPLQSIRHIYRQECYRALCARAKVRADGTWFPAYRSADRVRRTDTPNETVA